MIRKSISAIVLASTLMLGTTVPASAVSQITNESVYRSSESVQPRINWTGVATLSKNEWCNIVGENNIASDSPTVFSYANNPAAVTLRVVDSDGQIVGRSKTVYPGHSVTLDRIPWYSGTYTIQGCAQVDGNFTFKVD